MFCWRYCKDTWTFYFWYFRYILLRKPKMIVSTCRKLRSLSACQKWTSLFTSSLEYYILKNPAMWSANNILSHNSRTRILPDMGLLAKYQYFRFFRKSKKNYFAAILSPFYQILGNMNFPRKKDSKHANYLTSWKS